MYSSCFNHRSPPIHERSYTMSTRREFGLVQPYMQYVNRTVMVSMHGETATSAVIPAFGKWHLCFHATTATSFACVPGVNLHSLSTAYYSLVGQHLDESVPGSVADVFSEMMIFNHIFDLQVFNGDEAILLCECVAEFMQEVQSLIGDFHVLSCYQELGLHTVPAPFFLPAQTMLQPLQPAFSLNKMSGVFKSLASGKSGKAFQAHVDANILSSLMFDNWNIYFTGKGSIPLSSTIPFKSQSFHLALWGSVQDDWNASNPVDIESFFTEKLKPSLRIREAVNQALKPWKAFLFTRRVFYTPKKVLHRLMNTVTHILSDLRVNTLVSACQKLVKIIFKKPISSFTIGLNVKLEKMIVNMFANNHYLVIE